MFIKKSMSSFARFSDLPPELRRHVADSAGPSARALSQTSRTMHQIVDQQYLRLNDEKEARFIKKLFAIQDIQDPEYDDDMDLLPQEVELIKSATGIELPERDDGYNYDRLKRREGDVYRAVSMYVVPFKKVVVLLHGLIKQDFTDIHADELDIVETVAKSSTIFTEYKTIERLHDILCKIVLHINFIGRIGEFMSQSRIFDVEIQKDTLIVHTRAGEFEILNSVDTARFFSEEIGAYSGQLHPLS